MPEPKVAPRLGEFLRARRALVRPEDHGLPAGSRRTPGLRREEVAMLAGVCTDYYIRLEQGREKHPSGRSRQAAHREYASPGLVGLMDAWPHTPALIYGRYFDLLAINPLGEALFSWLGEETNLLRAIFLMPAARTFYRDWATFYRDWATISSGCIAALRAAKPVNDRAPVAAPASAELTSGRSGPVMLCRSAAPRW